jgi:formylglycine-generating enzyme required for sulfatase activity
VRVSWKEIVLPPDGFLARLQSFTAGVAPELPTAAEWEYACRAGTLTAYSFGDEITREQVNCGGGGAHAVGMTTVAVKRLPANPWGLYEMHGNVWEWCADAAGHEDRGRHGGARVSFRALRGGSWFDDAGGARSASGSARVPAYAGEIVGFRFALRSTSPATVPARPVKAADRPAEIGDGTSRRHPASPSMPPGELPKASPLLYIRLLFP